MVLMDTSNHEETCFAGAKAGGGILEHGGDFPWVGSTYRVRIAPGLCPLQWGNSFAKWFLSLRELRFTADGGFQRAGDEEPLAPIGGVELRWRWNESRSCILIDFFGKNGKLKEWRWDELALEKGRSLHAPAQLHGVGHVGKCSFGYHLEKITEPVKRIVTPYPSLIQWADNCSDVIREEAPESDFESESEYESSIVGDEIIKM